MISDETFAILRLIRTKGVGEKTALALINHYQSAENVLKYHKKIDFIHQAAVEKEIKEHQAHGIKLITFKDPCYPGPLKEMPNFPFVLSVLGNADILNQTCISVVGSRNASYHALSFAKQIAFDIAQSNCVIVSGMARGIDSAAHLGALPSATIAVLAGGVDRIYPAENKKLYYDIADKGAIISEMPLGTFPGSTLFPKRNRIIAGLCKALCVIEAFKPSGTMITANIALELGKEVLAVPHFPEYGSLNGTNDLLRQGAHVLESVHDVFNSLHFEHQRLEKKEIVKAVKSYAGISQNFLKSLKEYLQHHNVDYDDVLNHFSSVQGLSSIIGQLEIDGILQKTQSGKIIWVA